MTKGDHGGLKFSLDVQAAMEKAGITQVQLAALTGITQAHLSRLLRGERGWKPEHIERVCRALKIEPLKYLADEIMRVPVRGIISRGAFPYGPVFEPKKKSVRTASAKMSLLLENGYCLEVQDDSLAPLIKKGTLIYVQQSAKNLNDGDLVVYVDPQGVGRLYLLVGRDSESMQLRSVSAAYPDTRIPAKHLPILDRVVVIFYP
jgi:transcriptional regulator with XRE-family HTH domain